MTTQGGPARLTRPGTQPGREPESPNPPGPGSQPGREPEIPSAADNAEWIATPALTRAIAMTLLLLVLAVVLGRADLAVVAVPFVVGTAFALHTRPQRRYRVELATRQPYRVEHDELPIDLMIDNPDGHAYDMIVVRRAETEWFADSDRDRPLAVSVPGAGAGTAPRTTVALHGTTRRWGRHTFPPVVAMAWTADGLLRGREVRSEPLAVKVFPRTDAFEADDAMPKAAGLVGVHRSRRPGDGGELAGIRRFTPGDRLRRIDWRASLRARELHVAQTLSDRDAELVIVLDVLHDAATRPPDVTTVTDITVRAAAGIVEHYTSRGDRVRLLEYGGRNRALRAGTSRRHHLVALEWLLGVEAGEGPYHLIPGGLTGSTGWPFRRHVIPTAALLIVLTPFLDRRSVAMLAQLARSGRSVVAVDTLPEAARPATLRPSPWSDVAFRLWRLERQNTIAQLLEHGVPTVRWAGAGSLDQVLRDISRIAAATG